MIALAIAVATAPLNTAAAEAYSKTHGGRALIVVQAGRTLHAAFHKGSQWDRRENVFSITKSVAALGVLAAVARGMLDLETALPVEEGRTLHVRDLLWQTSGLDPGYHQLYGRTPRDKHRAVHTLPTRARGAFAYGPSHYEALEALLARHLGGRGETGKFVERAILEPIGVRNVKWRTDRTGNPYFSGGMFLSPRELLSLGKFVASSGHAWFVPIVGSSLMKQATTGSAGNPMYGFGMWLNRNATLPGVREVDVEDALANNLSAAQWARSTLSRAAPPDLIALVGSGGQRVYISRSERLVIVRLGRGGAFEDPAFLASLFGR
jgi:CubicO group peptidase (beta-lactamase class C family)